VTSDADMLKIY